MDLQELTKKLVKFRDDRDWAQFHTSKDLALAINIEAAELLEVFLWKQNEEFDPTKLSEEIADVLLFSLLLCEKHGLDPIAIAEAKLKINEEKYPVSKAKGKSTKYTDL